MVSKSLIQMLIGALLLVAGVAMQFSGSGGANAALEAQCRAEMATRGPAAVQLADQCSEPAFASAITAQNAESAAAAVGSANRASVGSGLIAWFLIGVGLVLLVAGFVQHRRGGAGK
jgi:hypothetical protein